MHANSYLKNQTIRLTSMSNIYNVFIKFLESGQYFPSNVKNLQICSSMIYSHLITCPECPVDVKASIVSLKQKHRRQASDLRPKNQNTFYSRLWDRVGDSEYNGGSRNEVDAIVEILFNLLSAASPALTREIEAMGQRVGLDGNATSVCARSIDTNEDSDDMKLVLEVLKHVECNRAIISKVHQPMLKSESCTPDAECFYDFPSPPFHPVATMHISPQSLEKIAFSLIKRND